MNVLALDGALGLFSAAAARDGRIAGCAQQSGNIALERGLYLVRQALDEAGLGEREHRSSCGRNRPRKLHGPAHRHRLCEIARRRLAAAPGPHLFIRSWSSSGGRSTASWRSWSGVPASSRRATGFGEQTRRASGRTADVLEELLAGRQDGPLEVVGAPKDVLHALAERGLDVRPLDPPVTPAAAAAALAAGSRTPPASLHEVRADYGELPAAKIPKL